MKIDARYTADDTVVFKATWERVDSFFGATLTIDSAWCESIPAAVANLEDAIRRHMTKAASETAEALNK
jgi:hypothetical protein